jgi:hypothetical protein
MTLEPPQDKNELLRDFLMPYIEISKAFFFQIDNLNEVWKDKVYDSFEYELLKPTKERAKTIITEIEDTFKKCTAIIELAERLSDSVENETNVTDIPSSLGYYERVLFPSKSMLAELMDSFIPILPMFRTDDESNF